MSAPIEVVEEIDQTVYVFPDEHALERWSLDDESTFTQTRPATLEELLAFA